MIAATLGLTTLAYLAYRTATPANGLLLLSGILAVLALIALLSIPRLDWQDEQAETYRGILDDIRSRFPVQIRFSGIPATPEQASHSGFSARAGDETFPTTIDIAEPEVHRVDGAMLHEAKRMATEGRSIDDICRMIDQEFDLHDTLHREAFRRLVQAMIEQG